MEHIEAPKVVIREEYVLDKFEGEALPENLIERVTVVDGVITKRQFFHKGYEIT